MRELKTDIVLILALSTSTALEPEVVNLSKAILPMNLAAPATRG